MIEDKEQCADILDVATNVTIAHTADRIATASYLSEPEHDGTVTECVACGLELGARAALFKVRCIRCQELLEKKRNGYGVE